MTIDSAYWPEKRNNHGGTVYQFEFEIIDPAYIEVYAIDADDVYTLIDPADYDVTIGTFIAPISRGGRVTFDEPLDADVVAISIQRKTNIADDQEFITGQPFNAEAFEFQADKLTMILQEINASVCDCSRSGGSGGVSPIVYCKTYACNAWATAAQGILENFWLCNDTSGGLSNSSLDPLGAGLPEDVLGPGGYDYPNIITGSCAGSKSIRVFGNFGWRNNSRVRSGNGGFFAGYFGTPSPNTGGGAGLWLWSTASGPGIEIQKGGPGMQIYINLRRFNDSFELVYESSWTDPMHIMLAFSFVENNSKSYTVTAHVWRNGVYNGPFIVTTDTTFNGVGIPGNKFAVGLGGGTGRHQLSQIGFSPYTLGEAQIGVLLDGYTRNNPAYVDPNPECVPP